MTLTANRTYSLRALVAYCKPHGYPNEARLCQRYLTLKTSLPTRPQPERP